MAVPDTVNLALVTVPVTFGKVTPPAPPAVRVGAAEAVNATVPPVAVCTAMFPKFISALLTILIGVTIVADAFAVAVACALAEDARPTKAIAARRHLFEIFIFLLLG